MGSTGGSGEMYQIWCEHGGGRDKGDHYCGPDEAADDWDRGCTGMWLGVIDHCRGVVVQVSETLPASRDQTSLMADCRALFGRKMLI